MIRFVTEDDASEICRIYGPAVTGGATSFETTAPDVTEMRRRVASTTRCYPWLVDEQDGSLNGFAYATSHRARAAYQWSVEVSVYVDQTRRRKGCGRAMYQQLFSVLRDLKYQSAYAGISVPNSTSQAFHESMGFERIGVFPRVGFKHGKWRDVSWWYLPLCESVDEEPELPLELSQWRVGNQDQG